MTLEERWAKVEAAHGALERFEEAAGQAGAARQEGVLAVYELGYRERFHAARRRHDEALGRMRWARRGPSWGSSREG